MVYFLKQLHKNERQIKFVSHPLSVAKSKLSIKLEQINHQYLC